MTYDLVIHNGVVIDGTGSPGLRADVGILDGRIVEVGGISQRGRRTIDAEGHVVTPGFIDGHTHMDAQVMWDELGSCSCYHGVTTVVMGNCGFSLAPAHADERELVVRNLERAEDISSEALAAGIEWTWETFPEYLEAVDRQKKSINYAAYIGHSALRTWAMGERAFSEPASDRDLETMTQALTEALHAGAIGFTTSRSSAHATSDDRPVASRLATWDEVRSLVGEMGRLGAGVFELARDLGASSADPEERQFSQRQLVELARDTGVPITFGTFNKKSLEGLDAITEAGGRAFGQTHSRGVASVTSFRTRMPFDTLPSWKTLRARPLEEQRALLMTPEIRRALIDEAHNGAYPQAIGAEARRPDYEAMHLYNTPLPPYPTVAEIAAERRLDPVELIIRLSLDTDFTQLFVQPLTSTADDDLLTSMRHPHTAMTFSDSGAHVSQISDSSIQTHLLSYWVRERQEFTLEEAIQKITAAPAAVWGFSDRGVLQEGFAADLNIFDPATVGPTMPVVVHDLPGGARRLLQKASGFLATVVGGETIVDRGEATDTRPGKLIRGPLAANR